MLLWKEGKDNMRKSNTFSLDDSGFEQAMEFIHQFLVDNRIGKERVNAMLVLEEALGCLRDHKTDGDVHIRTRSLLGSVILELSAAGEAFSLTENMKSVELPKDDEIDGDVQEVIRTILLKSLTDDLKYRHRDGVNYIRVTLVKSKQAFLWHTLSAMMAAIVIGLILTFAAPGTFNSALDTNLLAPVKTMYMNALKMIVAPVVFFSIVSCIMQFSDLSALGRIGGKTLGLYFCTTWRNPEYGRFLCVSGGVRTGTGEDLRCSRHRGNAAFCGGIHRRAVHRCTGRRGSGTDLSVGVAYTDECAVGGRWSHHGHGFPHNHVPRHE